MTEIKNDFEFDEAIHTIRKLEWLKIKYDCKVKRYIMSASITIYPIEDYWEEEYISIIYYDYEDKSFKDMIIDKIYLDKKKSYYTFNYKAIKEGNKLIRVKTKNINEYYYLDNLKRLISIDRFIK